MDVEEKKKYTTIFDQGNFILLIHKTFFSDKIACTTKFPGTLEIVLPLEISRWRSSSNSHKMPCICGRAANSEKIDWNLISKALSFYKNTYIRARRESAGNIVIRIQRSRATFSVRVWRNEVCGTVPPDFQTLAASSVRSWDASRFPVVRKTAGLATFGRKERSK